jgi:DNA-binding GntR family transcriptional regulator
LLTSGLRRLSVVRKERQKQSIVEIGRIVTAIARRDARVARAAAERHVANAARSAFIGAQMRDKARNRNG